MSDATFRCLPAIFVQLFIIQCIIRKNISLFIAFFKEKILYHNIKLLNFWLKNKKFSTEKYYNGFDSAILMRFQKKIPRQIRMDVCFNQAKFNFVDFELWILLQFLKFWFKSAIQSLGSFFCASGEIWNVLKFIIGTFWIS